MPWYENISLDRLTTRYWCVYQFDYELPVLFEGYFWQQAMDYSSREEIEFFDSYEEAEEEFRRLWDEVTEFEERWAANAA